MIRTAAGSATPGKCGLCRLAAIGTGSRAQRVTEAPARAACNASAVPQAPAPITATLFIGKPLQKRALPCIAVAERAKERLLERRQFVFEAERRVRPAAHRCR